jgi:hypothetical protein
MQIAFIYGKRLSSALTKFWTGSTCYHVAFVEGARMWDMNLLRRRRVWPSYHSNQVLLAGLPAGCNVTREYLESKLETDYSRYGVLDYLLFSVRWAYHLVGKSTRNASGIICSEMVADDMRACGWGQSFAEVPSPADLELAILGRTDAINTKRQGVLNVNQ